MNSRLSTPQMALPLALPETARLANFVVGENQAAVSAVCALAASNLDDQTHQSKEPLTLVTGRCGKTHLLQAACHEAAQNNISSFYLPLAADGFEPEMLEGLERFALLAIDDVDSRLFTAEASSGKDSSAALRWERGLYDCLNRCRSSHTAVLVSMLRKPAETDFALADLKSRLQWGPEYHLSNLSEDELVLAVQQHANMRAMHFTAEVARYLVNRQSRDLKVLINLLNELDKAQLAEKRPVTIPFIREILNT